MNQELALQAAGPTFSLVQRHLPFLREIVTERLQVQIKENWSYKEVKPGALASSASKCKENTMHVYCRNNNTRRQTCIKCIYRYA